MSTDEWMKAVKLRKGKNITTVSSSIPQTSNINVSKIQRQICGHNNVDDPIIVRQVGNDQSSKFPMDQECFSTLKQKNCGSTLIKENLTSDRNKTLFSQKYNSEEKPETISQKEGAGESTVTERISTSSQTELQKLTELAKHIAASKNQKNSSDPNAESIYKRVKLKPNVNSHAFTSLNIGTSVPAEEDADMLSYQRAWKPPVNGGVSLKNSTSAPESLNDSSEVTESCPDNNDRDMKEVSSCTPDSSTWPRSPNHKKVNSQSSKMTPNLLPMDSQRSQHHTYFLSSVDDLPGIGNSHHFMPKVETPNNILDCGPDYDSPIYNTSTFKCPQHVQSVSTPKHGQYGIRESLAASKPNKSPEKTTTWPRRKGKIDNNSADVKRHSSISRKSTAENITANIPVRHFTGTLSQKGDRAHFINVSKTKKLHPPKSLNLATSTCHKQVDPQPATAKLVISSPVANRANFVQNPNKRSLCSPITADDLLKFWNYSQSDKWYNTLPRTGHNHSAHSSSSNRGTQNQHVDVEPSINRVPDNHTRFDFVTPVPVDLSSRHPSTPLYPSIFAMKHSVNFPCLEETHKIPKSPGLYNTWYDGVDASAVVVDSIQTSVKPAMSAFLQDHGCPTNRRDSICSSRSTNPSTSERILGTFTDVNLSGNSGSSRTSLDKTSSTTSEKPHSGSDSRSIQSEKHCHVTSQDKDTSPVLLVEACGILMSSLKCNNDVESVDQHPGIDSNKTCNHSENKKVTKTTQNNEPAAKRQKVNTRTPIYRSHRKVKQSQHPPSYDVLNKANAPHQKVTLTDSEKDIQPMPIISTSFFGHAGTIPRNSASGDFNVKAIFPSEHHTFPWSHDRKLKQHTEPIGAPLICTKQPTNDITTPTAPPENYGSQTRIKDKLGTKLETSPSLELQNLCAKRKEPNNQTPQYQPLHVKLASDTCDKSSPHTSGTTSTSPSLLLSSLSSSTSFSSCVGNEIKTPKFLLPKLRPWKSPPSDSCSSSSLCDIVGSGPIPNTDANSGITQNIGTELPVLSDTDAEIIHSESKDKESMFNEH